MAALLWESDVRRTPAAMRMVLALGGLIAGYVIARHLPTVSSTAWFAAAVGLCALAAAARGRWARLALFLAILTFGSAWFALRIHEVSPSSLRAVLVQAETGDRGMAGEAITVDGVILTQPRVLPALRDVLNPYAPRSARTRFELSVDHVHAGEELHPVRGKLSVRIGDAGDSLYGPSPFAARRSAGRQQNHQYLRAGDRIRITGIYVPPPRPMNPGEPDRRMLAAQEGSAGILRLPSLELIEPLEPRSGLISAALSRALAVRGWLTMRAHTLLLGPLDADGTRIDESGGRALLAGLILGEREPAIREVRGAFTRLGLAHVLCISGFHLAMLAGVGMFILRLGGDLGRWEAILIAMLLAVYLTVLPFQAPVWRAALMVLGLLVGDALGRRYDRLAVLAWIAAAILIWRPMDLWSIGFQLSFGLVASLIWLGGPLHKRIWGFELRGVSPRPDPGTGQRILEWFRVLFTANLLCWGIASPVIAYHTGLVSPLAVLAGIVAVPAVMLVLIGGYAVVLLGVLIPPAAELARIITQWLAGATASGAAWMDAIPASSLRIPSLSLAWTIAATVLVIYWFWRGHVRDRAAWAGSIVLAAWLAVEIGPGSALGRHVALRMDALAVGDGTCILLRSGDEAMLWDCGSLRPGIGQVLAPRALRSLGAWRVPTIIVTHPHLDHFNAILDVAEPLGVRTVVVGERFMERAEGRPHGPEAFVVEGLHERGIEIQVIAAGATMQLGRTTLEFFSPPAGATWVLENDQSLAAIVRPQLRPDAPQRTLLLTGDMEREALEHTMMKLPDLRADIMEAPHHGSAREPALEFVWRVDPRIVIQSTGPSRVNDERWGSIRAERIWYKTARDGAAWAEIHMDGAIAGGAMNPKEGE